MPPKKKKAEVPQEMEGLLLAIDKKFGAGSVTLAGINNYPVIDKISSGSIGLDLALNGGYGRGRMVEIYGPESSGKTTGCLHAIAETQKLGEKAAFIDVEHALDFEYAEALGVCMEDLAVSQPDSGEQALEILDMMVRSGLFATIVLDSVAALVPKAELDGEMGSSHMGLQARMMSQACRKLAGIVKDSNTLVIFTNQIRMKIGIMFGSPETVSGGNALKFYASQRLDFRRRGAIKEGEEVIGNTTEIKVIKNKIGPPNRRVEVDIIYGKGIDAAADLLNLAIDRGLVERAGAWIKMNDKPVGQGIKGGVQWLRDNPEIAAEIREKIMSPSPPEEIEEPVNEEIDE